MIISWFMRRVVFPLAFWWQMRKQRTAQQDAWKGMSAEAVQDDEDEPTLPGAA